MSYSMHNFLCDWYLNYILLLILQYILLNAIKLVKQFYDTNFELERLKLQLQLSTKNWAKLSEKGISTFMKYHRNPEKVHQWIYYISNVDSCVTQQAKVVLIT